MRIIAILVYVSVLFVSAFAQDCSYGHDIAKDGLNQANDVKLSFKVNGGVCQQCQKGEWVDVDSRNCPDCSGGSRAKTSRHKARSNGLTAQACSDSSGNYSPWAWRYSPGTDTCERCEDGDFVTRATQCNTCKSKKATTPTAAKE
jgi:hypothetical protein